MIAATPVQRPAGIEKWCLTVARWLVKCRRSSHLAMTKYASIAPPVSAKPVERTVEVLDTGPSSSRPWWRAAATLLVPALAVLALIAFKLPRESMRLSSTSEPATTGTASSKGRASAPVDQTAVAGDAAADLRSVSGVPEVIDTTTLKIGDEVLHLYGVEWARGGNAQQLRSYLGDRAVVCRPTSDSRAHRCEVEGRDLSIVVLFNGGARALPQTPPEFRAAEQYARSEGRGVWKR